MSEQSRPKILLTGPPGCGKTTLIKTIASEINRPLNGFFTAEIKTHGHKREHDRRFGFEIETFHKPSKKAIFSHIDIKSQFRVGRYGVDIAAFDEIALPELRRGIDTGELIIVDEIGKMELLSSRFRSLVEELFRSDVNLLATIYYKSHPFCDALKKHPAAELIEISNQNRHILKELIISKLVA